MKNQLLLVAMLSVGTALTTMAKVKPVAASLTPPATYDYSYTWNATASEQYLNVNGVDSIPLYTRTADGIYWNYTSTFQVVEGLIVTQTFNRSNTTWQSSGTSWKPDSDRIGSDNTVGAIVKYIFSYSNNTPNNYLLYWDNSNASSVNHVITFNTINQQYQTSDTTYVNAPIMKIIHLPSYYTLTIGVFISNAMYFDAWYLRDLGISQSYQEGLDAETQGILTDYLGTDAQQIGWVLIGIAAIFFAFKGGK